MPIGCIPLEVQRTCHLIHYSVPRYVSSWGQNSPCRSPWASQTMLRQERQAARFTGYLPLAQARNPTVNMPRWISPGSYCVVSLLLAVTLTAADPDLKRLTPVADDQQIPVGDFLRPPLLTAPTINRAGTGISAIVTSDEDRHLLLVYDVKTQKYGTIGGTGDYDITGSEWLGNTRVLYSVSGQKLVGIGLFAAEIKDLDNSYPLLEYFGSRRRAGFRDRDLTSPLIWNRYDRFETVRAGRGRRPHHVGKSVQHQGC